MVLVKVKVVHEAGAVVVVETQSVDKLLEVLRDEAGFGRGSLLKEGDVRLAADAFLPQPSPSDGMVTLKFKPAAASTPSTALTAGAAAATATSLREEPAVAQLLSRLLAPLDELDVLQFKVFNTPRRFRSTLKVNMQQFGVSGRIRRETTTCVSVTAVVATDKQAQQGLAEFVKSVIKIAPIRDVDIEDRSRPYTRPQPIERKSVRGSDNADILTMYEGGVQVDKVSQAVIRGYKDVSEISSDPIGAKTTPSSVASASRSN